MSEWFYPQGALARGDWETVIDDAIPGWHVAGLRVADLAPGDTRELPGGNVERLFVPLEGSFRVTYGDGPDTAGGPGGAGGGEVVTLPGRRSVFAGPTDVLYTGVGLWTRVSGSGRIAVAEAPATTRYPPQVIAASDAPGEIRGAGRATREVRNFGMTAALQAERLLVCEVLTPAGNWSSYPPHKHDEHIPGIETQLEEVYYFEVAPEAEHAAGSAAVGTHPFGFFGMYPAGDNAARQAFTVNSGDVVLVPSGYHGPATPPPGYDMYYLNVMAGPGPERAWRATDDPCHAHIRERWTTEQPDPRLPFGRSDR